MGIVNKRNAIVGWLTLKVGRRVVRKKAQEAAASGKRAGRGAKTGALAAAGAVLLFLRSRRGGPSDE
jgi:UPF0716 family protein affecting phage T7 exclusion